MREENKSSKEKEIKISHKNTKSLSSIRTLNEGTDHFTENFQELENNQHILKSRGDEGIL